MINLETARELLRCAVETQGRDFVYNPNSGANCYYAPQPTAPSNDPRSITGCVVGVALDLAGETRHREYEGSVMELQTDFPDMLTIEAAHYLCQAQDAQDLGSSWGQAYDNAEKEIELAGWVDA